MGKAMSKNPRILRDGTRYWGRDGQPHRANGPASEFPDGTKEWFLNGKIHREGGPAVDDTALGRSWYVHGKLLVRQERP